MTLGQLLLVALIVAVIWVGSKLKKHEERLDDLEGKGEEEEAQEKPGQDS